MNSQTLRHSASHILAAAVLKLYPKAKLAIGPATETGYYYDFDLPQSLTPKDLKKIEKKMRAIINSGQAFEKKEVSLSEAKKIFKNQPYKLELIKDLAKEKEKTATVYKLGDFFDLCKGPHVKKAQEIAPDGLKLTKISGAYWKGDEKNKMLTRIYGVAFKNKKELKKHLAKVREAKKRDHRKLGKELDLFVFSDLVGKGLPLLTPKGAVIRQELEKFIIEEETKRGYERTFTPDLAKIDLYKKSGHLDHYQESMYDPVEIDGEKYILRPMTCPHQFMIYNSRPRSYRELPLRYAELAKLYRKEQSGELSGLMRVMSFTLADAHIVCRPDQVEQEFKAVVELVQHVMQVLGIKDYWYRFSKWDPKDKKKYTDNPKAWKETQELMEKIIKKLKLEYVEAVGEAAFYGPKLDIQMRNVNGKEDTAFTIQIDFDLPQKFDMTYIDKDGQNRRPMIIHRSSIGAIERVMALLIELYAGAFPTWLSPVQAAILPVSEKFNAYGKKVKEKLQQAGIRAQLDDSDESLGKKIRQAQKQKVPYMLIVGEKEAQSDSVAVRSREKGDEGPAKLASFIKKISQEIKERK